MNILGCGKRSKCGRAGFTLVEVAVAMGLTAIIIVGSTAIFRNMVTASEENKDAAMATMQVQAIGFWIGRDAVQAEVIEFGDSRGFPLTLENREKHSSTIVYDIEPVAGQSGGGRLIRTELNHDGVTVESTMVAQDVDTDSTRCFLRTVGDAQLKLLVLEAAATVDRAHANGTYPIHPRGSVIWKPA